MTGREEIESLYEEAQSALKAKDYNRASDLLRQVLIVDENYKDVSRLLAQTVERRRRRWYQHPLLWGSLGVIGLGMLGIWLAPSIGHHAPQESIPTTQTTVTLQPTSTPNRIPTPILPVWKRVHIGQEFARDVVTAIISNPKDPDVIYIGTQDAGIYKSINGGASWQPKHNGIGAAQITSLYMDYQDPDTIYASAEYGGVYKTVDGAETWIAINKEIDYLIGLTSILAVDPQDSQYLYYTNGSSLFKSVDGGHKWELVSKPSCPGILLDIAVDPGNNKTLYLANERNGSCKTGIYRSLDTGENWEYIGLDEEELYTASRNVALSISPDGEFIYIMGLKSLFISPDRGKSWFRRKLSCNSLAFDESNSSIAYCGMNGKLAKTMDGGISWQTFILPGAPGVVEAIFSPDSRRIIAGGGWGLYSSTDGGNSWAELNNGLGARQMNLIADAWESSNIYVDSNHLFRFNTANSSFEFVAHDGYDLAFDAGGMTQYRANSHSILQTQDQGKTWREINLPVSTTLFDIAASPHTAKTIYATFWEGGSTSFFVSTDGGLSWERGKSPALIYHPVMYLDAKSRNIMYTVGNQHVLISKDAGRTWINCCETSYKFESPSRSVLAIHPQIESLFYLATRGSGILISSDYCESWLPSNEGLMNLFVNTLAIDPNNPGTVYAGTDGGAYISYVAGATWGQVNDGLLGATVVYSIAVDKESNVYAATPYGIFKLEKK